MLKHTASWLARSEATVRSSDDFCGMKKYDESTLPANYANEKEDKAETEGKMNVKQVQKLLVNSVH